MWLTTYDVAEDDRRRTALRAWLRAWGEQILRSGFLLDVDEGDISRVVEGARRHLRPPDDLLVASLCPRCELIALPASPMGRIVFVGGDGGGRAAARAKDRP